MTKKYQKPAMRVVKMQYRGIICVSGKREIKSMHSNAGMDYVGSDASVPDFDDDDIR